MQDNNKWDRSPIHLETIKQTSPNNDRGLYYNSQYEIENFLQLVNDEAGGDPFKVLNDPTYSGFKIFFHFDAKDGLLADETNVNSALAFFKRTGQTGEKSRYELLKRFITTLSKVNSICPWIFQEINGLKEVYERDYNKYLNEYEIEIQTLETVDHKILSLVEMYRNICFDQARWVEVLPENLRKFSMSIYVYDFRMFSHLDPTALDFLQTIKNTDVRNLNHVMFDFGDCEFTQKSGGRFFDEVTNNRSSFNNNNLSIVAEKCITSSLFRTITGNTALSANAFELAQVGQSGIFSQEDNKSFKDKFVDRLSNTQLFKSVQERKNEFQDLLDEGWKRNLGNIANAGIDEIVNRAEAELSKLYLGNVYGFGFDDLARLNQDNSFRASFNQNISLMSTTQSLKDRKIKQDNLGNING